MVMKSCSLLISTVFGVDGMIPPWVALSGGGMSTRRPTTNTLLAAGTGRLVGQWAYVHWSANANRERDLLGTCLGKTRESHLLVGTFLLLIIHPPLVVLFQE
uniref:Secreted protein n=1 Tax=Anopheles darlingi TaxID=43151 RepID=A0A2M4DNQ7_ANODA